MSKRFMKFKREIIIDITFKKGNYLRLLVLLYFKTQNSDRFILKYKWIVKKYHGLIGWKIANKYLGISNKNYYDTMLKLEQSGYIKKKIVTSGGLKRATDFQFLKYSDFTKIKSDFIMIPEDILDTFIMKKNIYFRFYILLKVENDIFEMSKYMLKNYIGTKNVEQVLDKFVDEGLISYKLSESGRYIISELGDYNDDDVLKDKFKNFLRGML